jgi:hypothetical protein
MGTPTEDLVQDVLNMEDEGDAAIAAAKADEDAAKATEDASKSSPEAGVKKDGGVVVDVTKVAGEPGKVLEVKKEEDTSVSDAGQEVTELRQLLRDQKREIDGLKAKQGITAKALKEHDIEIPEGEPDPATALLSAVRDSNLNTILEVMEMSDKFTDVRAVCSQAHFDDIIEAMAVRASEDRGIPYDEAVQRIEDSVWKMPNPYKFMYPLIKEYHPDYTKNKSGVDTAIPAATPKKEGDKTVVSLASIPGAASDKTGWTAERIDNLSEDELHLVPADIYKQWLQGKLK